MTPTVSEIVELRVYPIKSCRGVKVDETMLTRKGLDLDRRWMIINATNTFITIRNNPRMTLIDTALATDPTTGEQILTISVRSESDTPESTTSKRAISIPTNPAAEWLSENTHPATVEVWGTKTDAYKYAEHIGINALLSDFLGEEVSLVMKGPTPRPCGGNGHVNLLGRAESVNFPDVLPVLVASRASLAELNERLRGRGEGELTIERFRPNIIVDGVGEPLEAWTEDVWKTIRINPPTSASFFSLSTLSAGYIAPAGSLDVDIVARCARCQVPNVDPDSAVKHPKQPWDTLMAYRRVDPGMKFKPYFGMLGCPRRDGAIRVGMRVEVLEKMGEGKWVGKEHVYETGF